MRLTATLSRSRGFSLIEFLVAMTVSIIILSGLSAAFVSSSRARTELERSNQQIENGRYALQIMADDLALAGFLSQFNVRNASIPTPAAKPDPCATTVADLTSAMVIHIQGQDLPAAADKPACIPEAVRANTDILVVRHVATCVGGTADCAMVAGAPYFQASLCAAGNELASTVPFGADQYRLDTNIGNLNRTQRNCTTLADMRRYLVHIYYVANNDRPGDGIPTLKRLDLGANGAGNAAAFPAAGVAIADGIEGLQIEYGVDSNLDGQPDAYTANPDQYTAPSGTGATCPGTPAGCVENWRNVMVVKVHLLARNTSQTPDFTDDKTYTLGLQANGNAFTVGPSGSPSPTVTLGTNERKFKRKAFDATIRLVNPASRRDT